MKMKRKYAIAGVASVVLVALGLTGAAVVQQFGQSQKVYEAKVYDLVVPPGGTATLADWAALVEAIKKGEPLPTGFSIANKWGHIETNLTGLSDPATGDAHAVTTIIDKSEELETARLTVDGQVVVTATRANGMITDRSGMAIATISAWVPPSTGHVIKVDWISADGQRTQAHELDR